MKYYLLELLFTTLVLLTGLVNETQASRNYSLSRIFGNPEIGRFMSIDPILREKSPMELQKLHGGRLLSDSPYSYSFNNPVRYVDPDGKIPIIPLIWAAVEVGMAAYDAYDAYTTATDPNATAVQKTASVGGFIAGLFLPGGGYSKADNLVEVGIQAGKAGDGVKLLPTSAGPVGQISPSEVINKTPAQIDDAAKRLGLEAKGPNPQVGQGAYVDPQTGQQRILSHPNAEKPHGHVNSPSGNRVDASGAEHKGARGQEKPEVHLPIKKE
jgi:RHS repeat-associated protein